VTFISVSSCCSGFCSCSIFLLVREIVVMICSYSLDQGKRKIYIKIYIVNWQMLLIEYNEKDN
jgi:hypothetical protein